MVPVFENHPKNIIMKYVILLLALIFAGCTGNSQNQAPPTATQLNNDGKKSCLAEMVNPAQWISLSQVASIVNVAEENIDQKVEERLNSLAFEWKTGRMGTMKIGKKDHEMPIWDKVAMVIKSVDEELQKRSERYNRGEIYTYTEYFDKFYSFNPKKDMKAINDAIDQKAKEDEDFDAKTAKKAFELAPSEGDDQIANLGDRAHKYVQTAPTLRETRLSVLHGNVVIQLFVDISDDDSKDLEVAIKVAESILAKCD